MKHILRLRAFIRPYWGQILLNLFFLFALTGLGLVIPRIIQHVVDDGLLRGAVESLLGSALILLVIGLLTAGLNMALRYNSERVAAFIGYDLRNKMYDHIQYLPFTYHDHAQTGQLITRCIEDVRAIQNFAGSSIIEIAQMTVLAVGVVAILVSSNPLLAVIALLPLVPMFIITFNFGERVTKLFYQVDNALGDLSALLQENVSGVQVVRAFAREPYEISRFDERNRGYFNARLTLIGEWSKVMPTTQLLVTLGTILILYFGGQMVLRGEMSVGEIVAFNAYLLMLSAPVQQLTWLVNQAGEASAGAQRVLEVLDHAPEIQSPPNAVILPPLS
ncbi:MAG: ABC transporter ATP-binding protein, partial [Anaerolineales bacterium]